MKDKDRYIFTPPKKDDDGEAEQYFLVGPDDFDEYLDLIKSGTATPEEQNEFYLRLIEHFIAYAESDTPPRKFVMRALADAFCKVLQGGRWEDEFPLPWTKSSVPYTRAEWDALSMSCAIENRHRENPEDKLTGDTGIIKAVADEWCVSYETARAAYYKNKKHFANFLPFNEFLIKYRDI